MEAAVQNGSLAEKFVLRFLHIFKSFMDITCSIRCPQRITNISLGKYVEYVEIFLGAASGHPYFPQSTQDLHPGDKGKFEAFFGRALKQSLTVFYLGYKKKAINN